MSQPLLEVFGFSVDDFSIAAVRHRAERLCPFQGAGTRCTKVSVQNPLGVCSIRGVGGYAINCPTRFKEDWLIAENAAKFFFPSNAKYRVLPEIRLKAIEGESAGNIDIVLVQIDENNEIIDFGSIEIQAVYISGNIRNPFEFYMSNPNENAAIGWSGINYPRPDYLSSSRKRLAPQMLMKGGILKAWNKKQAIVLHKGFYETLPRLNEIDKENSTEADIIWLIYDLIPDEHSKSLKLTLYKTVYTDFESALLTITKRDAGDVLEFENMLANKLKKL